MIREWVIRIKMYWFGAFYQAEIERDFWRERYNEAANYDRRNPRNRKSNDA